MARPRKFVKQTVVDQALSVFRKHGYKGASLHHLLKAMGISKSSFYETFGSKHELFLTALTRFQEKGAIYNFIELNSNLPTKTMLNDIFTSIIDSVINGKGGCMFGNCAVEFSNTDPEVSTQIANGIKQLERMFAQIIEHGKKNGELSKQLNTQSTAHQLLATFYGLQIMANANLSREALNEVATSAVAKI